MRIAGLYVAGNSADGVLIAKAGQNVNIEGAVIANQGSGLLVSLRQRCEPGQSACKAAPMGQ